MPAQDPHEKLNALEAAYAALNERCDKLRTIVSLSAGWHWEQDAQFRLTSLTVGSGWPSGMPPMGRMLGMARWEMPGMSVEGGWSAHKADVEAFTNVRFYFDGEEGRRTFLVTGVPLMKDGIFAGYHGVGSEITDQVRAEQALAENQRRLASVLQTLPGMAYRRGLQDWSLDFASEGARSLTGYAPADLMAGTPRYRDLIHPDDYDAACRAIADAVAQREPFKLSYRIQTLAGQKWVTDEGQAVVDSNCVLCCIEGLVLDVSEARRAQDRISLLALSLDARVQTRTAELEAANKELEMVAYSLAHDLRAPLASVAMQSQLLEREGEGSRRAHFARRIRAGVLQMSELLDALLALARLANVDLREEPVDLAQLARDELQRLATQDPRRRIEVDIAPSLPTHGDPKLLRQVVANLVGNAWKFSAKKPKTVVSMGRRRFSNGATAFYVSDEGEGFDMAHAARLFQPFERLHSAQDFGGTGIGLSLSRKILALHGGQIWADATPGRGATFFFTTDADQLTRQGDGKPPD